MHTPFLIGLLVSFALMFALSAGFFWRAWSKRREDREYLFFSLTLLAAMVLMAMYGAGYTTAIGLDWFSAGWMARVVVVPSKLGLAFLLHFALRYTGAKREWAIMSSAYALAALFSVLGLSGGFWQSTPRFAEFSVAGFMVHRWDAVPTAAARPFYLLAVAVTVVVLVLMVRQWRRDHRALGTMLGAAAFSLMVVNELALRFDWYPTVPLLPVGLVLFAYGVSLSLLHRHDAAATELKRHTQELQERSLDIDASCRELQMTQQRLVRTQNLAVVGELAAVIAHEVRNPLAIVNNAVASLRKRHTTADDRQTLLGIINEEMARLDKLVGRLLNYARPVVPNHERIALRELIVRTLALLEDRPDVNVELSFEGGASEVHGDTDLLLQVFENIVTNAVQAMHERGRLRVKVSQRRHSGVPAIAIDFHDDGEGMDDDAIKQAMSPFFTTRPTGTGLGLPIVARNVKAHGGVLEIDSATGRGTTVSVLLPERGGAPLHVVNEDHTRTSLLP